MRKEQLDNPVKISTGSPILEPELPTRQRQLRSGLARDLGARADRMVVIDYGDGRAVYYDRGATSDDIYLGHATEAERLSRY